MEVTYRQIPARPGSMLNGGIRSKRGEKAPAGRMHSFRARKSQERLTMDLC